MDYKDILNLMKEMNKTSLTKLEVEQEGFKICIEKAAPVMNMTRSAFPEAVFTPGYAQSSVLTLQSEQTQAVKVENTEAGEKKAEELVGKKLVAPMVGTFYISPAPDKPSFVKVGDKVKKGQTICIIEAMKLMNEIESEYDGEIVQVLVNNEEMVEFGQPLFLIK